MECTGLGKCKVQKQGDLQEQFDEVSSPIFLQLSAVLGTLL